MQLPYQKCPDNFHTYESGKLRLCGKKTDGPSCDSVKIITPKDWSYQYVQGRVRGYQYASTDAFAASQDKYPTIDGPYVDGISITYGHNTRSHIYTLASAWRQYAKHPHGTCPETGYGFPQPEFVGNNYICSSGNPEQRWGRKLYHNIPLWSRNYKHYRDYDDYFYFYVKLPSPTREDIELRICTDQSKHDENVYLEVIDLYIKE